MHTRTIIEPFRIKMTEPLKLTTRDERVLKLRDAHHNVFLLDADDCAIDLLTDSGTGAMSTAQWAAMMLGDESYAGSRSWKHFESTLKEITGKKHIFPTHQGRAAEALLAETRIKKGMSIPNNSHFDTTRANIEFKEAKALNFLPDDAYNPEKVLPFKGNIDLKKLENFLSSTPKSDVPFCMITVTNNSGGGQPVSMANLKSLRELTKKFQIPLIMDACRFAENAFFIREREAEYKNIDLMTIAKEMFSYVDAATMSCKKDGLANIGGFFVCNDDQWAEDFRNALILKEGFPTYGGLAGRDLEAIAVGLREALDYNYQCYRHATVRYLVDRLESMKIPHVKPAGGHAVFLDAKAFCPHLNSLDYPGIGIVNALYIEGGVRSVELGSLMFGRRHDDGREEAGPMELVRMAFPRRVYTQSHFDYLIEVIEEVWKKRSEIKGHKILYQPKLLRHFTAKLAPKL